MANNLLKYSTLFLLYLLLLLNALPRSHNSHLDVKPLSDEKHYADKSNKDHNVEFDHEAFLGEKEARKFEDLTPEESKKELGLIFQKIDTNNDGHLSESEMKVWIKRVNQKYAMDDAERNWREIKPEKLTLISFPEHILRNYGTEESINREGSEDIKAMIRRDEKRWKAADGDGDELLTKKEYSGFLYPETADFMKDIVVKETLEDIDSDGDGSLSLKEFLDDLGDDEEDDDTEWLVAEENDFKNIHDKDGDGKLNPSEVAAWMQLEDTNQINDESDHLFHEADTNRDSYLSLDEVLNSVDLFVGSQATEYGDLLIEHDEF